MDILGMLPAVLGAVAESEPDVQTLQSVHWPSEHSLSPGDTFLFLWGSVGIPLEVSSGPGGGGMVLSLILIYLG